MSILDTFYILFKTNAEEAKQGYKQVEAGETAFGASVARTDQLVTHAGEHIVRVFENVAIRIASAFAIEQVIEFTARTAELNAQLGITAERLGLDVQELAAWEAATKRSGGSAEGFEQTLDFLNRGMADIATKGTSRLKPFFDELNIRVTDGPKKVRPLLDILGDLSDKLSTMGKQQAAGIGEKLGIDPGTLLMLQSGRRSIEDLVNYEKQLGVATEEDTKKAHAFEQQLDDLGTIFHHISTVLFGDFLPGLTAVVTTFKTVVSFLESHKPFVEGFFIGIAGIISTVYYKSVLKAIEVTLALLAEWLLIPLAIIALGAAFAFLYDDVMNFLAGNKSVIGELSKKWPEFGETVRKTAKIAGEAWNGFVESVKASKNLIVSVLDLIAAAWENHQKSVARSQQQIIAENNRNYPAMAAWVKNFNAELEALETTIEKFAKLLGADIFKFFIDGIRSIPGAINTYTRHIQNATAVQRGEKSQEQVNREDRAETEAKIKRKFGPHALDKAAPAHPAAPGGAAHKAVLAPPKSPTVPPSRPTSAAPVATGQPHPAATLAAMKKGQDQIHIANTTHLGAQTSKSLATHTTTVHKTVKVDVGGVTVNADKADAAAIPGAIADHLGDQIRQAINHHDDGVAY